MRIFSYFFLLRLCRRISVASACWSDNHQMSEGYHVGLDALIQSLFSMNCEWVIPFTDFRCMSRAVLSCADNSPFHTQAMGDVLYFIFQNQSQAREKAKTLSDSDSCTFSCYLCKQSPLGECLMTFVCYVMIPKWENLELCTSPAQHFLVGITVWVRIVNKQTIWVCVLSKTNNLDMKFSMSWLYTVRTADRHDSTSRLRCFRFKVRSAKIYIWSPCPGPLCSRLLVLSL